MTEKIKYNYEYSVNFIDEESGAINVNRIINVEAYDDSEAWGKLDEEAESFLEDGEYWESSLFNIEG